MRVSSSAILTPLLASLVSAGCYGSGDKGVPEVALNGIDTFCKANQGYYVSGQDRYGCIGKANSNQRWVVGIQRPGENGGTLEYAYCMKRLRSEINCKGNQGGESTSDWWFARADAQTGNCKDLDYINKHPNGKRGELDNDASNITVYTLASAPPHLSQPEPVQNVARTALSFKA